MFNSIIAVILMFFNFYTIPCEVVKVDNTTVTILTQEGEVFEFYGDNYQEGDEIVVLFNSNGTTTTIDDKVERAGRSV